MLYRQNAFSVSDGNFPCSNQTDDGIIRIVIAPRLNATFIIEDSLRVNVVLTLKQIIGFHIYIWVFYV